MGEELPEPKEEPVEERLPETAPVVDAARDGRNGVVDGGRRQLSRRELSEKHRRQGAAAPGATPPPSRAPVITSMSNPSALMRASK